MIEWLKLSQHWLYNEYLSLIWKTNEVIRFKRKVCNGQRTIKYALISLKNELITIITMTFQSFQSLKSRK